MTEMSDLMKELACAVRQKDFSKADEALSVIAARHGYGAAIAKGRRLATPHEPVLLAVPNVVMLSDLPDRENVEIIEGWCPKWRRKDAA